jgi:hypothetical protein
MDEKFLPRTSYVKDFVFTIVPRENDILSSNLVFRRVPSPLVAKAQRISG